MGRYVEYFVERDDANEFAAYVAIDGEKAAEFDTDDALFMTTILGVRDLTDPSEMRDYLIRTGLVDQSDTFAFIVSPIVRAQILDQAAEQINKACQTLIKIREYGPMLELSEIRDKLKDM